MTILFSEFFSGIPLTYEQYVNADINTLYSLREELLKQIRVSLSQKQQLDQMAVSLKEQQQIKNRQGRMREIQEIKRKRFQQKQLTEEMIFERACLTQDRTGLFIYYLLILSKIIMKLFSVRKILPSQWPPADHLRSPHPPLFLKE